MTELPADRVEALQRARPGDHVDRRYRLERIAGAGGMATVWRAYDERLERPVAIKVISDALAANPSAVARFAREARTHARIQHPNLVQVYDYSTSSPQPYLVMEYVDGETLSERLDRGGLSAAAIQTLATELLSAIACVHDGGVLHRDIKPGNVLLDSQGNARLTDFGLARLDESTAITRPDEIVGTLRFLAPELLRGQPATRQSDLFALGVVLQKAIETAQAQPRAISHISEIATWLTAQDPLARPADAHAVLDRLRGEDAVPSRGAGGRQSTARVSEPTRLMRTLVAEPIETAFRRARAEPLTEALRRHARAARTRLMHGSSPTAPTASTASAATTRVMQDQVPAASTASAATTRMAQGQASAATTRTDREQSQAGNGGWARARLAAASALAAAAVVTALVILVAAPGSHTAGRSGSGTVAGASGTTKRTAQASSTTRAAGGRSPQTSARTIDGQLSLLAREVRSAAGG